MLRFLIAFLGFAWSLAVSPAIAGDDGLLIFAPASMSEAIMDISKLFEKENDIPAVVSIAATSQLARQLEAGAPADIFISADKAWMDWAEERNLIDKKTLVDFASNRLVIAVRTETENWADPLKMLEAGRFAMADAENVPAGRYAKKALTSLGLWEKAKPNAVFGENVRVALARVATGEVEAAIVYESDLAAEPMVRALYTFDEKLHPSIVYQAAMADIKSKAGILFLRYLIGPAARDVLRKARFFLPEG